MGRANLESEKHPGKLGAFAIRHMGLEPRLQPALAGLEAAGEPQLVARGQPLREEARVTPQHHRLQLRVQLGLRDEGTWPPTAGEERKHHEMMKLQNVALHVPPCLTSVPNLALELHKFCELDATKLNL